MARLRAVEGTSDTLPGKTSSGDHVAATFRAALQRFGYTLVRTPLIEDRSVFERALSPARLARVVDLARRGGDQVALALRPAGWPGVIRAFVQHGLDRTRGVRKLSYLGPMAARGEAPDAPVRLFDAAGAEAIGSSSPVLDAEVIALAARCFTEVGVHDHSVVVNTVGDVAEQARYQDALHAHFQPVLGERCEACQAGFLIRPSQLLACKAKACQPSNRSAPGIVEQLGESARRRFAQVLQCLREARIGYEVDPTLLVDDGVATHTVFEVRCPDSPQGRPLASGSRRDGVVAALDGPQVGAVGFAIDCDRVRAVLEGREHAFPGPAEREAVFVAPILGSDVAAAFALAHELRAHGIAADGDFEERPLKALFKHVDKRGTRLVLTVATGPAGEPAIKLHDRPADTQVELAKDAVVEALRQRLRE